MEACDPKDRGSLCQIPNARSTPKFVLYEDVPPVAVEMGKRLMQEGKLDVGGIEYLEAQDGRLVFYDINANSNLRKLSGLKFDPFERVARFLLSKTALPVPI
jgi:hypothetical protein